MKYFKYQYQNSLGVIWGLFSDLSVALEKGVSGRCEYGHTMEIINSAMNGNIANTEENEFDLRSYELVCSRNDKEKLDSSRKKFLTIVDLGNDEEKDRVGYGEVSSNKLKNVRDAFEEWENEETFESRLAQLSEIRKQYILTKGIDIVSMIKSSLNGIPEAVAELKELTLNDDSLKELVVVLCENGADDLNARLSRLL